MNGNQPDQVLTVTYSDDSTSAFKRSLSDWCTPQQYQGESKALVMDHRNRASGTNENRECCLYAYSLELDTNKMVKTLTLPTNSNLIVLALTLEGPPAPVNLAAAFNVPDGIVGDGSTFSIGTSPAEGV